MSTTSACPHCHQTRIDKTPITPLFKPHSKTDEIAYLHAETRRIEDAMLRLHEERAWVLRRLNAAQSNACALSPEVLGLIFQFASPSGDHFREEVEVRFATRRYDSEGQQLPIHLLLASVSHYWHQVVFSSPALWNSISAKRVRVNEVGKWEWFLKTSLERSGSLPLDISFAGMEETWGDNENLISPAVDELIFKNASRIRSLSLLEVGSYLWLEEIAKFTGLEALVICFRGPDNEIDELDFPVNAPLTHLHLHFRRFTHFDRVSASLTVLHLSSISLRLCIKTLIACPRLVEYRCYHPLTDTHADANTPVLSQPLVLKSLEHFEWPFGLHRTSTHQADLFTYVEMPALTTLVWDGNPDVEDPLLIFLRRLPSTLKTIRWENIERYTEERNYMKHIRGDTQLQSITLHNCNCTFLSSVMNRLSTKEEDGSWPFPCLNYFQFSRLFIPLARYEAIVNLGIFHRMADTLEQRRGLTNKFTFAFDLDIPKSNRREFLKLKKSGLNVRLILNGTSLF